MQINIVVCKIAYPQVAIGKLALISNDLATFFIHFINDSTSPFWVWNVLLEYSWKTWDVNALVLSRPIFLIHHVETSSVIL